MNNKIIGVILIIAGVGAAIWGYDVYDSASSNISRNLGGDAPTKAWVAMIGGGLASLAGVFKILKA